MRAIQGGEMAIDYAVLKTEIQIDPKGLELLFSDIRDAADKLNEPGLSGETIEPENVSPVDMQAAVVATEYAGLPAAAQRMWLAIVGLPDVPIRNASLRQQVKDIWAAGTATRGNLVALQSRSASRVEVLFGEGISVSYRDVARARDL